MSKKNKFTKPELTVEDLSTALYRANLQLAESNKKLQKSEQLRSLELSNISHDLRSPLTSLKANVEYLLTFDNLDKDEISKILIQINEKITSIEYFLNQFVLLNTLEEKNTPIHFQLINATNFFIDIYSKYQQDPQYINRKLSFQNLLDKQYHISINIPLFTRAIDNILTNALKYSNVGDIIQLCIYRYDDEIIASIEDSGIGIKDEYLANIFERTYMISDSRTPSKAGSCGIGLSIVSSIMKGLNGRVWCESVHNKGSTFYLALPVIR